MKTKVSLRTDNETDSSILQVVTPDRPSLLAKIANIFSRFDLVLYNARISTLGERVEDTFYLRTADNQPINDKDLGDNLKQTIRNELDSRIKESEQESIFQSIKIGR
jgi:[protein-PII] uridylyltransferase